MNAPDMQQTAADASGAGDGFVARLRNAWVVEFSGLRWRLMLFTLLARLLPQGRARVLRSALVRGVGATIGEGTGFAGMPKLQSQPAGSLSHRLVIGSGCSFGSQIILEFGEVLTIGDHVTVADRVVVLTTTHQLGPREHRAGAITRTPVTIGDNVEIGAGAIILPGVTLGDGARVLPESVVNSSVAAGVTVGGIPARPIRPGQTPQAA